MGFRDFIKDYIVDNGSTTEPSGDPNVASTGIAGIPKLAGVPVSHIIPPPATPESTLVGHADPTLSSGFTEKLRSKYSGSPSFSIVQQFATTLESLADAIPEEGNRFRAALKVLQKQTGVDVSKLTEGYQSLIGVLDAEQAKFQQVIEGQKSSEIGAREQQVTMINGQIEGKNAEIQSLMEQRDAVAMAIVEQKTKLGAAQASFEGAQSSLRSEIGDALNKLKIYVPATSVATK